jgi:hypothetical protein
MFFFYFFIFLYVLLKNKRLLLYLIVAYQAVLAFVLPGVFQFFNNFQQINYLFRNFDYKNPNFFSFIKELSGILLLRINPFFSLTYIIILPLAFLFIKRKKENNGIDKLSIVLILSFFANILLLFIFVNYLFSIFMERSFWFFYFYLVITTSLVSFILIKQKKLFFAWFLIIIFVIAIFINYVNPGNVVVIQGETSSETFYFKLIESITSKKNSVDNIIFIDERYSFYPLANYFFSKIYPKSGKYYKEILNLKKNLKNIQRVKLLSDIDENEFKKYRQTVLVLFHPDETEINYARYLKEKYKNLVIYSTRKINSFQYDFFTL